MIKKYIYTSVVSAFNNIMKKNLWTGKVMLAFNRINKKLYDRVVNVK
jgi:hypothetical protein